MPIDAVKCSQDGMWHAPAKAFQGGHCLQTHRSVLGVFIFLSLNQGSFFRFNLAQMPLCKHSFTKSLLTAFSGSAQETVQFRGQESTVSRPELAPGWPLSCP